MKYWYVPTEHTFEGTERYLLNIIKNYDPDKIISNSNTPESMGGFGTARHILRLLYRNELDENGEKYE